MMPGAQTVMQKRNYGPKTASQGYSNFKNASISAVANDYEDKGADFSSKATKLATTAVTKHPQNDS